MNNFNFPPDERVFGKTNEDKVHKVLLRMLKVLFIICEQYDIPFWLDYGTMLGAVRHKGFIPWDMEADVGILRNDYDKLNQILYESLPSDIFFQTKDSDPDYQAATYYLEAKLRDKYSSYPDFQKNNPETKWHNGIQVDIFIYDIVNIEGLVCYINKFEKSFTKANSYLRPEEIEELKLVMFEDTSFYIPKGYNAYLRRNYGEYMDLPPVNQRHTEKVDVFTPCLHKETLRWPAQNV